MASVTILCSNSICSWFRVKYFFSYFCPPFDNVKCPNFGKKRNWWKGGNWNVGGKKVRKYFPSIFFFLFSITEFISCYLCPKVPLFCYKNIEMSWGELWDGKRAITFQRKRTFSNLLYLKNVSVERRRCWTPEWDRLRGKLLQRFSTLSAPPQ